ncbi:15484_t:CDS:2, partial [Funneliformis geosporum]
MDQVDVNVLKAIHVKYLAKRVGHDIFIKIRLPSSNSSRSNFDAFLQNPSDIFGVFFETVSLKYSAYGFSQNLNFIMIFEYPCISTAVEHLLEAIKNRKSNTTPKMKKLWSICRSYD